MRTVPEHLYGKRSYDQPWNENMNRYIRKGAKKRKQPPTPRSAAKPPPFRGGSRKSIGIPPPPPVPGFGIGGRVRPKRKLPGAPTSDGSATPRVDANTPSGAGKTPRRKAGPSVFERLSSPAAFTATYKAKRRSEDAVHRIAASVGAVGFGSSARRILPSTPHGPFVTPVRNRKVLPPRPRTEPVRLRVLRKYSAVLLLLYFHLHGSLPSICYI